MKVYAINGSPRTNWNTADLCKAFLEGVTSVSEDIEVELIHLSRYDFKGCISCYACKLDNPKTYGFCNYKDGIYELLKDIAKSDGILFASPIYFGEVTSLMRAFMERLLFPFNSYEEGWKCIAPKRLKTAVIYNMTVKEKGMIKSGYPAILNYFEQCIKKIFKEPEHLYVFDTYQFKDYSKYRAGVYDVEAKKERYKTVFPEDCRKAYEMGARMAQAIIQEK